MDHDLLHRLRWCWWAAYGVVVLAVAVIVRLTTTGRSELAWNLVGHLPAVLFLAVAAYASQVIARFVLGDLQEAREERDTARSKLWWALRDVEVLKRRLDEAGQASDDERLAQAAVLAEIPVAKPRSTRTSLLEIE